MGNRKELHVTKQKFAATQRRVENRREALLLPAADMLKELAPVPEQEKATEEEVAQAMEKQQNLVRDLLWLSEQGYILVFSNNTVSRPRTVSAQAPSPKKAPKEKR